MAVFLNIWFWHTIELMNGLGLARSIICCRLWFWHLEISQSYLFWDIWMFVMYFIYGISVPSLLIESTDSMIHSIKTIKYQFMLLLGVYEPSPIISYYYNNYYSIYYVIVANYSLISYLALTIPLHNGLLHIIISWHCMIVYIQNEMRAFMITICELNVRKLKLHNIPWKYSSNSHSLNVLIGPTSSLFSTLLCIYKV